MNHWLRTASLAGAAVILVTIPLFAQTPATQPERTQAEIIQDLQDASRKLGPAIGSVQSLTDPAVRAKVAPVAVPLLQRMVKDVREFDGVPPAQRVQAETQFLGLLTVLGDPDAASQLTNIASSSDPAQAIQGQSAQIYAHWFLAGPDAAAQGKVADELEPLDKAHPENTDLTQITYAFSQMASSPALKDRFNTLLDSMNNPTAAQIKELTAAQSKLTTMENKPLTVTGLQVTGVPFTSADWKGKVILVDFWATWCGPCREELPRVKKAYSDFHAKGLEIVGVSNDFSADTLTTFTSQNQMPWPELLDADAASKQQWNPTTLGYGIYGIPTMFLIDKKGVLRTTNAGQNMETLIPQLLSEAN